MGLFNSLKSISNTLKSKIKNIASSIKNIASKSANTSIPNEIVHEHVVNGTRFRQRLVSDTPIKEVPIQSKAKDIGQKLTDQVIQTEDMAKASYNDLLEAYGDGARRQAVSEVPSSEILGPSIPPTERMKINQAKTIRELEAKKAAKVDEFVEKVGITDADNNIIQNAIDNSPAAEINKGKDEILAKAKAQEPLSEDFRISEIKTGRRGTRTQSTVADHIIEQDKKRGFVTKDGKPYTKAQIKNELKKNKIDINNNEQLHGFLENRYGITAEETAKQAETTTTAATGKSKLKTNQNNPTDATDSQFGRHAAYVVGGLTAGVGLTYALTRNRGQQSNAQLYGQQPLY